MPVAFLRYQLASLSDLEREALDLIYAGVPTGQIAIRLGVSPRRVSECLARSMSALGAADLDDLVGKLALVWSLDGLAPVAGDIASGERVRLGP
ncbi:DNA-binding CsgD family transcriptional regulator [Rhodoblastus acidophilus]|uniref:LuxR C-terminal-related transcriptional regulator n=1 Tax=Rhodoblastus acidophilus TaxID=1074 RepID=UPI00222459EC|nr:LuxR C-terminal-related transcriptional regulator [Rhodoblastus acidophilus]MCW2283488.1 DNA-binding CsgD family transcriptional regulator [Rhodoblastus acidophilus]MCW2332188.1 DNA-binding CsgD family transcriptional regulator [Rhodoblastus acidophilus]